MACRIGRTKSGLDVFLRRYCKYEYAINISKRMLFRASCEYYSKRRNCEGAPCRDLAGTISRGREVALRA